MHCGGYLTFSFPTITYHFSLVAVVVALLSEMSVCFAPLFMRWHVEETTQKAGAIVTKFDVAAAIHILDPTFSLTA